MTVLEWAFWGLVVGLVTIWVLALMAVPGG